MVNCPRCGSSRVYRNDGYTKFEWKCHMCKCEFNHSFSGSINFGTINDILKQSKTSSSGYGSRNNIPKIDLLIKSARKLFDKEDYDGAFQKARDAIKLDNQNVSAWILVTEIFIALKKYEDANSAVITILNIDHKNAEAWYLKSRIYIGQFRYEEALNAIEEALKLEKDNENFIDLKNNLKEFLKYQKIYSESSNFNFNPVNEVDLLTIVDSRNIDLFKERKISSNVYNRLIENFTNEMLKSFTFSDEDDIYEKIRTLASFFAKIQYKSVGEMDGLYSFNVISIDERRNKSVQISTFIHELAHHLLSEIFELSLMYIFDSAKTDDIEAFVYYVLSFNDQYLLMNEYCAHTVENHFMPKMHKNFGSFFKVLEKFDLDSSEDIEKINYAAKLGNTFAQDVISMLNKFFDDKLEKEIKKQYIEDTDIFYKYTSNRFKTDDILDENVKLEKISLMFLDALINVKIHNSLGDLMAILEGFKDNNK